MIVLADSLRDNSKIYRIYTKCPSRYCSGNMGLAWKDGKLIGAVRLSTSIAIGGCPHFFESYQNKYTQFLNSSITKIGYLDLKDDEIVELKGETLDIGDTYKGVFRGLEDGRLIVWDDELYIYGSQFSDDDPYSQGMMCYKLDDDFKVTEKIPFKMFLGYTEKNWMAIPDKPKDFVYKIAIDDDLRLLTVRLSEMNPDSKPISTMRGSTPLLKTDNGYISIVHQSYRDDNDVLHYIHHVVTYDNDYKFLNYYKPFIFEEEGIEFCTGLTRDDQNNLYISYSTSDGTSNIIKTTITHLFEAFTKDETHIDIPYIKNVAQKLEVVSPITSAQYYWMSWKRDHDKDSLYSHYAILLYFMDRYLLPNTLEGLEDDDSVDAIVLRALLYKRIHAPYKVYSEEVAKLKKGWMTEIKNHYNIIYKHYKFIV